MEKIKIGILGYGNLGKGVEIAISKNPDMELLAVFTRRNPSDLKIMTDTASVYHTDDILSFKDKIDVLILCGGSATDLPVQGPEFLAHFNTVDSFDTHAKIPEYFMQMDNVAKKNDKVGIISVGWDPGLFSIARAYSGSVLSDGKDYTFWGRGVSQGHSDAIRRIEGVKNAIQYTVPVESAIESARSGKNPELSTREKHKRECYVVLNDGADKERIENEIKNIPNYFADYDTTVHFISEDELLKNHSKMPHGGVVIRSGKTDDVTNQVIEFSLKLDSNPQFTGSVLVSYARATYKFSKQGDFGAKTVLDVPPIYLSPKTNEELLKTIV